MLSVGRASVFALPVLLRHGNRNGDGLASVQWLLLTAIVQQSNIVALFLLKNNKNIHSFILVSLLILVK